MGVHGQAARCSDQGAKELSRSYRGAKELPDIASRDMDGRLRLLTALVLVLVPANLSAKRTKVGELIDTDHDVSGTVYIVNQDTIMIDRFSFDNNGFGVYINVATEGANKKAWARNRIDVPYPSGSEGEPIDQEYTGSKADTLIINLKQVGVKARDVKWLSVWCPVFQQSFGHVVF